MYSGAKRLSTTGTNSTHLGSPSSPHANSNFILWMKMKIYHLRNLPVGAQRKAQQRKTRKSSKNESCSMKGNTSSPPLSWLRLIRQLLMDRLLRWHIQPEVFKSSGVRSFPPLRAERIGDGRPSTRRVLMDLYQMTPIVITHPSSSPRKSLTMKVDSVPIISL